MTFRTALIWMAMSCLLVGALSAQPLDNAADQAGDANFPEPQGPMVLYDQTDSAAGNGVPDQDFEAAFDAYDSEAADDFDVTFMDGWIIQQINTVGTTGTPGGALVDVNFYTDNGGTPLGGMNVCSYDDVPPTVDNLGSLTVDLPTECELDMGLHWMAIQVNQNFGTFGQHFWSNRSVQSFAESVWRNPGDGFATGCLDWTPQTTCGVGGGTSPDLLFTLVGVNGVPQETDIGIDKSGELMDDTVVYTITVTNNGPNDATGVEVTDMLPAPYVSDDCGGMDVPPWTWTIGDLANGEMAVCNITVDVSGVTAGTEISNTAQVTADQDNINPDGGTSNTVFIVIGTVLDIPTLGQFGLIALLLSLVGAGIYRLRRR